MDQRIADLLAKQEITEVLYRYSRATDRADLDLLRSVFHPNAHDDHGMYVGPIEGLIERWKTPSRAYPITQHAISNILIDLDGAAANVESYFNAVHRKKDATGAWDELLRGRYLDRFEQRDGVWRIAKRVVIYDWSRVVPAQEHEWWEQFSGDFKRGVRGPNDPSYAEGVRRGT